MCASRLSVLLVLKWFLPMQHSRVFRVPASNFVISQPQTRNAPFCEATQSFKTHGPCPRRSEEVGIPAVLVAAPRLNFGGLDCQVWADGLGLTTSH